MTRWFESVAEARARASRVLPASVCSAVHAGSEQGRSLADNEAAFAELGLAPRLAAGLITPDLAVTVMGQQLALPVLLSPTGVQAVHPDGELAVARAAASRGLAMGLSSFASVAIEDVVAVNPATFFQIYWSGPRSVIEERIERARRAGAAGLILTLDWSFAHARDWGSPFIPERIDARAVLRYAPEVARRPRWLARWVRAGGLPTLGVPNMTVPGGPMPTFFEAYGEWAQTAPPTWDDVAWLCRRWGGAVMVKGVARVDDARRCVDAGASAISVSNHGGNNLDTTPASIRMLPSIAEAVGSSVDVVLDGGVRRGSDVVKAAALGATAVMIGRPYLWGLAANGQAGVENVVDVLRSGLEATLRGLGRADLGSLATGDVVVPAGFARALGAMSSTADA